MIVPSSKLVRWVALVVLPFSLLSAVEPAAGAISVGALAVLVTVVLADAMSSRGLLAGISVALPPISRMTKDRPGKLEVRIQNQRRRPTLLRLALALPGQFESPTEVTDVALPSATEWSRLPWLCKPRQRGRFPLEATHLEAASRWGFWTVRKQAASHAEIRVYPNVFTERKELAALFLHRGSYGLHTQRQVGKGREFEQLREYIPGDGFDEIHWKATGKRGRPITKVFQVERTQEIYVIIDASRLSGRASGDDRPAAPSPATPTHGSEERV